MKKKLKIVLPLLFILVIVFAPAKFISAFIPNNSGVELNGLTGTIWNAKISSLNTKGWAFEEVKVDTNALSLLTGKLGADVIIDKGDIKGSVSFSAQDDKNFELANANLNTSLSKFEKYIPFKGVELNGTLASRQLHLSLVNSKPTMIGGSTSWNDGGVVFNGKAWQLGDFSVHWITNQNGDIKGVIQKSENILDIKGDINISKNGLLEFKGSVSTRIDKQILSAFSFFADGKKENGRQAIKFKKKIW